MAEDKKPNVTKIYQRCGQCAGTGRTHPPEMEEGDCPSCDGGGYSEVFQVDMSDLTDTVADILDKVNDIKEKLDEA